ncbi:MAG: amino acid ABC transporter permease [Oscillospiraceae bacterium]|jgi:polar amino acid transport system permease protein|nr:amino acid ABC transporter permease [Oscillospiraceae bacterium]
MSPFASPAALGNLLAQLLDGSLTTLRIFAWTLVLSLPLGLIVALGRLSRRRWLAGLVSFYILIMRGTPLMLQIITVHFILPGIIPGMRIDRFVSTIVAFALNYAAYFAEIYRGGIQSIPVGQAEAARVLGFTRAQTFLRIILPQTLKRILQPVSNEVITLVKDTSLATVIAVGELFRAAKNESSRTASIEPLFIAGVFYLLMNLVVTCFFHWSEKRLSYYQ